jgi:cell shape-determining protein MreC
MTQSPPRFPIVLGLCVAGVALSLIPPEMAARWRSIVRDALRPGQAILLVAFDSAKPFIHTRDEANDPTDEQTQLEQARHENRQLAVQLAVLRQRALRVREMPSGESSEPLIVPSLVEARVLGEETAALWRGRKLVGAGTSQGVLESALVLQDERPLVDLGGSYQVATGDAVYAGRCVIGKIAEVGKYSSSVQLISDSGFSGRARLARRSSRGLTFGSEGTLVGTGNKLCRLRHISEPVNVGDEVYTGGTDGMLPFPMFYGRVIRAELEATGAEWSIDVEPAAAIDRFDRVQVLRLNVNSGRILAN